MEAPLTRLAAVAVGAVVLAGVIAPAASAATTPVPVPTRAQLAAAMLTLKQIERHGLASVSGAGASYSGDTDPSLQFTTHGRSIDTNAFALATSPRKRDERGVMLVVTFGRKSGARVQCRIDEGSPEVPDGADACVSERHPSGVKRPVGVSYGLKPAPGVNVIAYVSADPISFHPNWAYPTAAELTSAAKHLAQAQVARLLAQGLIPVR